LPALVDALLRLGEACIATPSDPRLAIVACPGRPACASASVATRADAARLAALGLPGTIHVSGCAKGCARSSPAVVTLVGEGGRYGIVRHGRAGDEPRERCLTIKQVVAALQRESAAG
jgi:precorrin-3B synthase